MAQAMHAHSAEDILRKVKVPALILVGERDNFVPPWLGHVMASRIPVAEMHIVPGGTHGSIIEEPRMVNRLVLDFLERHLGAEQKTVSLVQRRSQPKSSRRRASRSGAEA
jgi:pimeloyl-ACP methyl ester carboxylesterase